MKKLICLTIAFVLLTGLAACDTSNVNTSSEDSSQTVSTETNQPSSSDADESSLESDSLRINELENQIDALNDLLSDANVKNDELQKQIDALNDLLSDANVKNDEQQKQIDALNDLLSDANAENDELQKQIDDAEKGKVIDTVYVKNKVYLTIVKDYFPEDTKRKAYTASIEYEDGTVVEVLNHRYIWTVEVTPDGSKIIMNDLEMEVTAEVFLYDVDKRETRKLQMTELPEGTTPAYMEWLDDRYFLFVVQNDCGSVVRGGDVYLYDTEKDEYKPIIVNSDIHFETAYFGVNNAGRGYFDSEFVLFNSVMYNEHYNFADNRHHILSIEEIFDLYNNNNTIDLSKASGLSLN